MQTSSIGRRDPSAIVTIVPATRHWASSPTTIRLRRSLGQQLKPAVLGVVGVLVLVDEDVPEGARVLVAYLLEQL